MAGLVRFDMDDAGIQALLKSDEAIAAAVDSAAEAIASNYGGRWPPAVRNYTTRDRRNAAVSVQHPAALREEAKHGHLSKAVSAAGLTLYRRG